MSSLPRLCIMTVSCLNRCIRVERLTGKRESLLRENMVLNTEWVGLAFFQEGGRAPFWNFSREKNDCLTFKVIRFRLSRRDDWRRFKKLSANILSDECGDRIERRNWGVGNHGSG